MVHCLIRCYFWNRVIVESIRGFDLDMGFSCRSFRNRAKLLMEGKERKGSDPKKTTAMHHTQFARRH